jgi:hypothetical protein
MSDVDMDTDTVGRCMQPEGMANQSSRPSKVDADADALFGAVTVGGITKLSFNSPIANVRHLGRRLQLP